MATLPLILDTRDAERASERAGRGLLRRRRSPRTAAAWAACLAALTLFALLLHGYHPFAEDGGLYAAGIERLLDPTLFPHSTPFVTEHLRFSVFAPIVAKLVRLTRLPLPWALFLLYLGSLGFTFGAARQLLRRVVAGDPAQRDWDRSDWNQLAGLALLAVWATLPVAGTSLVLLDPYLTARSFCTPLTLLAMAYALDEWSGGGRSRRSAFLCVLCLAATALLHPLMAAYAAAFVLTLRLLRVSRRGWVWSGLTLLALGTAATVQATAPTEPAAVVAAELSRYYWFLSQWRWYELCGLAGPLLVLLAIWHAGLAPQASPLGSPQAGSVQPCGLEPSSPARNLAALCEACAGLGVIATLVAALFAHVAAPVHLVARLQPLRVFQPIYAVMALLLGAWLWTCLRAAWIGAISPLGRSAVLLLPAASLLATACVMGMTQRSLFPASDHLELPWQTAAYRNPAHRNGLAGNPAARNPPVRNPWSRAFLWARAFTPRDALFALDADYITAAGEDAQGFRAAAQRSALPDFSKDGGEASITPALAAAWQQGVLAQTGLSSTPDADRAARLLPLGVTWMVLRSAAVTAYPCPYDNGTVKVCRLDSDGMLRVSAPSNSSATSADPPSASGD
jgi:hypothetical protein